MIITYTCNDGAARGLRPNKSSQLEPDPGSLPGLR